MENHTTQEFERTGGLEFRPAMRDGKGEIQVHLAAWFMRRFLEYARSLNQRRAPVNNFFEVGRRLVFIIFYLPIPRRTPE